MTDDCHLPWVEVFLLVFWVGLGMSLGIGEIEIFLWSILFCSSMVIYSFGGYNGLGWHLWSLIVCITLDHNTFIVSTEKSGVILIGLPLYVTL